MEIYNHILAWYKDAPLSERERMVLEYRHGLTTGCTHTLEETGKVFGATRQRMKQIEVRAYKKIVKFVGLKVTGNPHVRD